jgi:putative phage-type endonuclease
MNTPKKIKELQMIITDFFVSDNLNHIADDETELESLVEMVLIMFNGSYISKDVVLDATIRRLIKEKIEIIPPIYNDESLLRIKNQIIGLKKTKQPEQRTAEWYEFRKNRLTASDLATAINANPYGSRGRLVASKCGFSVAFKPGAAIIHGVKFEPVATYLYEVMNNTTIYEYGCVPHPTIEYFAASPDGICEYSTENRNYSGRMLEIKCPKSRELTGFVPEYYELQIQGQLEVCELEYCDYLECVFKEYSSYNEFLEDSNEADICKTKAGQYRGAIFETYNYSTKSYDYQYKYAFSDREAIEKWEESEIEKIFDSPTYDYIGTTYWYLEKHDTILVKRDIERFAKIKEDIHRFWADVLKYRKEGYESLLKPQKSKKEKTFTEVYVPPVLDFLAETDDEDVAT